MLVCFLFSSIVVIPTLQVFQGPGTKKRICLRMPEGAFISTVLTSVFSQSIFSAVTDSLDQSSCTARESPVSPILYKEPRFITGFEFQCDVTMSAYDAGVLYLNPISSICSKG